MILVNEVTMIRMDGAKLITVSTISIWSVDDKLFASSSEFSENSKGPKAPLRLLPLSPVGSVTVSAAVVA
jgi:hypothetical protein